jgi:hypothetical protein
MKTINLFLLCAITQIALAQSRLSQQNLNDPHYPAKGRWNAGLLTTYSGVTPPPVLIGNVAYGISNKFSAGVIVGTTGNLGALGLKLNAIILERKAFRLGYRMISVYYPKRDGRFLFDRSVQHIMPWMLSMGVVDAEFRSKKGIRWSLGMGLIETHCVDGMMKLFSKNASEENDPDDLPFEVFTTVQASVSIPLSRRFTLRPDVFTVFKGVHLIEERKYKVGFPVIATVSLFYSF